MYYSTVVCKTMRNSKTDLRQMQIQVGKTQIIRLPSLLRYSRHPISTILPSTDSLLQFSQCSLVVENSPFAEPLYNSSFPHRYPLTLLC